MVNIYQNTYLCKVIANLSSQLSPEHLNITGKEIHCTFNFPSMALLLTTALILSWGCTIQNTSNSQAKTNLRAPFFSRTAPSGCFCTANLKNMLSNFRSSHHSWSIEKGLIINFANFTTKHLSRNIFFNEFYWKRDSSKGVFSCKFGEIFENICERLLRCFFSFAKPT